MNRPELDPRYLTADGCVEIAREMDRQADAALLLVKRHRTWARALRSRAARIDKAETLELEAKAERMKADQVANQPASEVVDIFDWLPRFTTLTGRE